MTFNRFICFAYCSLIFLSATPPYSLFAQERINGRAVLTTTWKNQEIKYVQGQVAAILKAGREKADIQTLLDQHSASVVREFDKLNWGLIEISGSGDIFSVIQELEQSEYIQAAEPNLVDRVQFDSNDPFFLDGHQWALKNTGQTPPGGTNDADIDAPEAWNISQGSANTIIAILDTGIPMLSGALSHPDLDDANKFILGPDYSDPNNLNGDSVRDLRGHGSHVTGIASAETNNSTGVAGVAGNCKVMIVQVFNSSGSGFSSWFRDGVIYAVDNGAKVINYSGGGGANSTKLQAVQYADSHDVLLVAAAGNDNGGAIIYPAAYSASYNNVIAVGATNHYDARASYSNIGSALNVVAPGGAGGAVDDNDIYATTPNYPFALEAYGVTQNYGYQSGTSMATPHVSGVAGLLFDLAPSLTPLQVRSTIEQTADDKGPTGRDNEYGYGRLNAFGAVNLIISPPAAPQNLRITNPSSQWANPILLWDANSEPDLDHYLVWRGTTPNWKTIPITWETSSAANVTGTTWTDNLTRIDLNTLNSTYYRVTAVDVANNESDFSSAIGTTSSPIMRPILEDETTSLKEPETVFLSDDKTASLPQSISLSANHPNPFNPETRIEYELSEAAAVTITIYNLVGQQITTLVNEPKSAGFFSVMWDGRDATGAQVGSGVYIYRLLVKPANGGSRPFVQSKKMVLVR